MTGVDACGCAFHHRDRSAQANGKANGAVRVAPGAMPRVVPVVSEQPAETAAVEEIELEVVTVRSASVAVASSAVALEDPSLGHRDPVGVAARVR